MESFFYKVLGENKLSSFIQLGRPWNGVLIGLICILGYSLFSVEKPVLPLLSMFFTFLFLYMGGTTLNDINDFETDKINMPYRPLQRGVISFREAYVFSVFCYVAGLILSFFLLPPFSMGAVLFILLSILYSQPPFVLERRTILGNITLSSVTVLIPGLSGGLAASKNSLFSADFILALSFLALFFLFMTFFKDLKDIEGDKLGRKKTLALYLGPENSRKIGFVGGIISYPLFLHFSSMLVSLKLPFLLLGVFPYLGFLWVSRMPFNAKREEGRFSKLRIIFLMAIVLLFLFIIL